MKIDVTQNLIGIDGEPMKDMPDTKDRKGEPVVLKTLLVNALMAQLEGDNPDGEEKVKRYELAKNIHDGCELDLLPEQIVKIKALVGKVYSTAVVGPVFTILNGSGD